MDTAWVHFHSHMGKKLNRAAFSNEVRKDTTERQWKGVRYRKSKQNIYYQTQEHKLHREWHEQHKYKGAFSYYIPEITVKRKDLTYNWVQRGLATSQGRNAHGGLLITLHGCNLQLQVSSLWSRKDLSMFKYTFSYSPSASTAGHLEGLRGLLAATLMFDLFLRQKAHFISTP